MSDKENPCAAYPQCGTTTHPFDDPRISEAFDQCATKAVERTLLALGVDAHRPLEAQKDMATLRELRDMLADGEFQQDLVHLRKTRQALESIQSKGLLAILGLAGTAALALAAAALSGRWLP